MPVDVVSSEVPQEGTVLKKVASLTLSKLELETKISKPKFVPEKLDFQLYEKFEGKPSIHLYITNMTHYVVTQNN